MSDRPGTEPPNNSMRDEDLDYLDAAVSETFDDEPTTAASDDPELADAAPPPVPVQPGERTEPIEHVPVARVPDTGEPDRVAPITDSREPVVAVPASAPRDTSWTWPLTNLAGLLVVIAINYVANVWEFNGQSTGDVVNKDPVAFQPAGWTFAIWGVIYALLLVFVVAGLLPAGRRNAFLQRISPYFLVANVANVLWIVLWHWEQFSATMVVMLVLLVSLVMIYLGLRFRNPFRRATPARKPPMFERLTMRVPFSVYLGWILVATLANLAVWLDRSGWAGGPLSMNMWAVVFMLVGTLASAVFVFTARDILIPIVMAVGFAGIANHAWGDSALVAVAAIVFVVLCAGLAFLAWVLAYDVNVNRSPFGRSRTGTPPPMTPIE